MVIDMRSAKQLAQQKTLIDGPCLLSLQEMTLKQASLLKKSDLNFMKPLEYLIRTLDQIMMERLR